MFYEKLMEWLKSNDSERQRETTSYEQNQLRDFAMWLDDQEDKKIFNEDQNLYKATCYQRNSLSQDSEFYFPALDFEDALDFAKEFCSDNLVIEGVSLVSYTFVEKS